MRGIYDIAIVPGRMISNNGASSPCPRCKAHLEDGNDAINFVRTFEKDGMKGRSYVCRSCGAGFLAVDEPTLPSIEQYGVDLDVDLEITV